jgi:cytochrome P450
VFGPKSFIVVSDPTIAKFILKDNSKAFDKGVLAEILEPIMGKGLIPADFDTWKTRKRAILPGFHKNWYRAMCKLVMECNEPLISKLESACRTGKVLDMETEFCSISLDIIGRAIFNYDFGSVMKTSPVIKAVYSILKETEHRSVTPVPYWKLPFAKMLVPRLRVFHENLDLLNNVLNDLIKNALMSQNQESIETLESRDYSRMENPSLLRFLVDMRGENATSQQLRDDLMTMLVAGHETTAAMLTWALFEMSQNPAIVEKARKEIDCVLGTREEVQFDDIKQLQYVRLILTESLRKYPEPPVLIRRALEDHELPAGNTGIRAKIMRGTDILIGVYNLHRSPIYWSDPETFDPDRFLKSFSNHEDSHWKGYNCSNIASTMYPNEVHADYAFLPFGGGARKCIGDQFAFMEACVILTSLIRRFDFNLFGKTSNVQMTTGATIHTKNGLLMNIKRRD